MSLVRRSCKQLLFTVHVTLFYLNLTSLSFHSVFSWYVAYHSVVKVLNITINCDFFFAILLAFLLQNSALSSLYPRSCQSCLLNSNTQIRASMPGPWVGWSRRSQFREFLKILLSFFFIFSDRYTSGLI